ncbi:protein CREG1-like [Trichogramma pretiosum]|uniref:protein CREG1-like n=1 Tax=Trichogramma pretiosum TaxID=7493 RepID=UPI0006C9B2B0|nr:protein CREG1-like [Trichogramma pretiosum]
MSRELKIVLIGLAAIVSLFLVVESTNIEDYRDWREFKEFQEFRAWKRREAAGLTAPRNRKSYYDYEHGKRNKPNWHRGGGHRHRVDDLNDYYYYNEDDVDFYPIAEEDRHRSHGSRVGPPPIDQAALMARYIVNQAGWTSVATISSRKDIESYPFCNVISFSDGPLGNGTGIPYLFLTPLDFTAQDVFRDNRATLMMTLAQGRYCRAMNYDPMDPRCARVVFSGLIKPISIDNPDYPAAKSAVFGRHPWLAHMPKDHHFFFATLKISSIALLDTFGGPKYIELKDYLHPPQPAEI